MNKAKVYVVDDHPVVREGLEKYINSENDMMVCGEADSALQAIKEINSLKPDIIIVDITLKKMNGIDLIKEINNKNKVPSLVLSMHDEKIYAERALRAGAMGYVTKNESMVKVVQAIRTVLDGGVFIDDKYKDNLLSKLLTNHDSNMDASIDSLTNRELEVFQYIGQGLGTKEVSVKLSLSMKTIETHKHRIKKKLGLKSASELTQHAVLWHSGLLMK